MIAIDGRSGARDNTAMRVAAGLLLLSWASFAQEAAKPTPPDPEAVYIKANYTKYEYRVPMRDGKRLFTAVYVPKDDSQPYPFLIMRTPYSVGPYGADNYREKFGRSMQFLKEGFIFVFQDVRGRYMSEGEFVNVRPYNPNKRGPQDVDEASDTYDTIDWLLKNIPNNNGRAGIAGISYPGFYAAMGAIDAHPALKASSPQAPVTDWFVGDDFHHNGGFYLPHFFRFFTSFGLARPEPTTKNATSIAPSFPNAYEFFLNVGPLVNLNEKFFKNQVAYWNEFIQHPNYDDYWKSRDLRSGAGNMKPAMLTVGGWFDAEDLFGALKLYEAIERKGKPAQNMLVMGPWYHGQWGNTSGESLGKVQFNSKTGDFYRDNIEYPFFLHHLKGKGELKLPKAYMFETGANQWRKFEAWPPPQAQKRTLHLQAESKLSWQAPPAAAGFEEYVSDPNKPVPFTPEIVNSMTRTHMVDDQRFAGMRPDVLVFQTEPLEEDVVLAGPVTPSLFVSTSGSDSDWVVKLIDVYPDEFPDMGGYQQLVRGELFRGRFRNGYEKAEAFTPNKVERVRFEMPDVFHNFRRGHRILIQIQSSWFPLVDRNPQKFLPNIYEARKEDFIKATQRVYRSAAQPSGIEVLVLPVRP
jgi:putative CocE/NonD family hydrolase